MNTLDKIIAYKKEELPSRMRRASLGDLKKKAIDTEPAKHFLENFHPKQINIIAEVKKASPSKGIIRDDFNPLDIAFIYQDNGAKALSILTDEKFFLGSLDYLTQIKKKVTIPCLRKDFTTHEYHLYEARAAGADAILLIAAVLDAHQLKDYQDLAAGLGMTALAEMSFPRRRESRPD